MHDPLCQAFSLRRPWPKRSRHEDSSEKQPARFRWRRHGPWWKPESWSPFLTAFGRGWYFPSVVIVWHREPGNRDSGEVCKHRHQRPDGTWKFTRRWRWHVHHWQFTVYPTLHLKRWLFSRCEECGRGFRYAEAPVSRSGWGGGKGPAWFRNGEKVVHGHCSQLQSLRSSRIEDEHLMRAMFSAYRLASDLDEPTAIERFRHLPDDEGRPHSGFRAHHRLERLLGWERDDNYDLVKADR